MLLANAVQKVILDSTMIRLLFVFIATIILAESALGQPSEADWVQYVIPYEKRSFDFKTVPKGATPEYRFVLKNPLQEPVHIKSITSSCTCTAIDFDEENSVLQTYEEFIITVRLRGDMFEGQRNATLTVVIDKPNRTELLLNVRGEIRADLKVNPALIDFGNVEPEKEPSRTLTVTYSGSNSQWRLVDTQCDNEFIHSEMTSDPSQSGIGRKVFNVTVSLDKSAPHGSISSHLFLISNDPNTRREIPIHVRATVGTVIEVSSAAVFLGSLSPGVPSSRKNAVLSGTKPFRITNIECDNPAVEIPMEINPEAPPRGRYIIPIQYRNPLDGEGAPKNGEMQATIRVTTDIPGLSPTFYATMSVRKDEE